MDNEIKKKYGYPHVLSVQTTKNARERSNNIQKNNLKLFLSLYYKRITKIISVSKSGIEQMRTIYPEIDAEVLYNGVDTEFFSSNFPFWFSVFFSLDKSSTVLFLRFSSVRLFKCCFVKPKYFS